MANQPPVDDPCLNCEAFAGLEVTVQEAYLSAFPVAATGLNALLVSLAALRLLYLIGQFIKGSATNLQVGNFVLEIIVFSFVSALLHGDGGMFWPLYQFIVDIGPWVGIQLVKMGGADTGGYEGFAGLIYVADNSVLRNVFSVLLDQSKDISLFAQLGHIVGILVLFVVYLSLSWKMTKTYLIGFFEATAVAVLAPFVITFVAFQQTRPLTLGAFRVLFASTAKMILGAMTIVVVLMLMENVNELFQVALPKQGLNSIWGTEFMIALFTGFMMTLATSVFEDVANRVFMTFGKNFGHSLGDLGSLTRLMISR